MNPGKIANTAKPPKLERTTFEAYLGIGVSIVATMNKSWIIQTILFVVAALMVFDISRRLPVIINSDCIVRWSITLILTLGVIAFGLYHIWPVYLDNVKNHREAQNPRFPSVSQISQISPNIGVQRTDLTLANNVLIAKHEHAITIWFVPLKHLIRLNDDGSVIDTDEPVESNPSKEEVAKALDFPPSCTPPEGGFGTLAIKDPKTWRFIGCQVWRCYIKNSEVVKYETFAHGYVISGLSGAPGVNPTAYTYFIQNKLNKKDKGIWATAASLKSGSNQTAKISCDK